MTLKEARRIIAVLMVAYPNYKPVDTELAASIWAEATEGCAYNLVDAAIRSYIRTDTSGFAPSPGRIVDLVYRMSEPEELDGLAAWSLVSDALRNSGYHASEEYERLPPLVQKALGSASQLAAWGLDESYSEGVAQSHFIKSYQAVLQREREYQKMPKMVKYLIDEVNKTQKKTLEEKRPVKKGAKRREPPKEDGMSESVRKKYDAMIAWLR